ncbi:MAG: helix-turn-helix transcriptional regulator [Planctomycetota bacterium]|nr:helix-turn-helix transcriptional regulator [Planctomycetota bacterium]
MELPRNMRQLRLRAGISVKKAAQASGFSDDAWYKLERGERWVGSEKRLHDIARALGVSAWELLVPQNEQSEQGDQVKQDHVSGAPLTLEDSAATGETSPSAGP